MNKKEEFMKFIKDILECDDISKNMLNFLVETLDIALTEERVKSKEFLRKMIVLTDRYIEKENNETTK